MSGASGSGGPRRGQRCRIAAAPAAPRGPRTFLALALGFGLGLATLPGAAQDSNVADRISRAQARVARINARADSVGDINAIENLQRSYGYYVDKMLWNHVLDLFTDDATLEIGTSGVYVGKDSIRAYLFSLSAGREGPIEGALYEHMQLQPIVTLGDDGQTARGRWRALILTGTSGEGSGGNWGEGPYENEYRKEGGFWKISKLHLYPTFYVPYEGGWIHSDPAAVSAYSEGRGTMPDRPPSDDYAPYPAAFTPPFHYVHPVTGEPIADD